MTSAASQALLPRWRRFTARSPLRMLTATDVALLMMAGGIILPVGVSVIGFGRMLALLALMPLIYGAVLTVRSPRATIVVITVAEVINLGGVFAGFPANIFRLSLVLGVLSIIIALRDPSARARLNRLALVLPALLGLYLLTRLVTVPGSQDVAAATAEMARSAVDCAFIVVVALLVQISGRPWTLAASIVAPLAVLAFLALVNQVEFQGSESFFGFANVTAASGELTTTLRQGGPLPDSNFWGRHLILGLPLALALILRAIRLRSLAGVVGWICAGLLIPAGIYLTQSRGTYIAAACGVAAWVIASGPSMRKRGLQMLPLLVALSFAPGIGNRFVALVADVSGGVASNGSIDPSVVGRTAAQEMAWAMFHDHPLFGVGPGVFPSLLNEYLGRVATAVPTPPNVYDLGPNAPHNLYAGIAAESGVVGLFGWAVLISGVIALAVIPVLRLAGATQSDLSAADRSLAAATLAAVIGWSVASIFLHLAYFRTFGLVIALVVGVAASARVADPAARDHDWGSGQRTAVRGLRVGAAAASIVMVVGGGLAAAVLAATSLPTSVVMQQVTLLPPSNYEGYVAYSLDIRSRALLLPTYAAIIVDPNDSLVRADVDNVRGLITLTALGDHDVGSARLQNALERGQQRLHSSGADRNYVIQVVTRAETVTGRSYPRTGLAAAVLGSVALLTILVVRRRRPAMSAPARALDREVANSSC